MSHLSFAAHPSLQQTLDDVQMRAHLQVAAQRPDLESLSFAGNRCTPASLVLLYDFVRRHTTLRSLNMAMCSLGDDAFFSLVRACTFVDQPRVPQQRSASSSSRRPSLGSTLHHTPRRTMGGDDDIREFGAAGCRSSIVFLNAALNEITDRGCHMVGRWLQFSCDPANTALQSVVVSMNPITGRGLLALVKSNIFRSLESQYTLMRFPRDAEFVTQALRVAKNRNVVNLEGHEVPLTVLQSWLETLDGASKQEDAPPTSLSSSAAMRPSGLLTGSPLSLVVADEVERYLIAAEKFSAAPHRGGPGVAIPPAVYELHEIVYGTSVLAFRPDGPACGSSACVCDATSSRPTRGADLQYSAFYRVTVAQQQKVRRRDAALLEWRKEEDGGGSRTHVRRENSAASSLSYSLAASPAPRLRQRSRSCSGPSVGGEWATSAAAGDTPSCKARSPSRSTAALEQFASCSVATASCITTIPERIRTVREEHQRLRSRSASTRGAASVSVSRSQSPASMAWASHDTPRDSGTPRIHMPPWIRSSRPRNASAAPPDSTLSTASSNGRARAASTKGNAVLLLLERILVSDEQCALVLGRTSLKWLEPWKESADQQDDEVRGGEASPQRQRGHHRRRMPASLLTKSALPSHLNTLPVGCEERVWGVAKLLWILLYHANPDSMSLEQVALLPDLPPAVIANMAMGSDGSMEAVAHYRSLRHVETAAAKKLLMRVAPVVTDTTTAALLAQQTVSDIRRRATPRIDTGTSALTRLPTR